MTTVILMAGYHMDSIMDLVSAILGRICLWFDSYVFGNRKGGHRVIAKGCC